MSKTIYTMVQIVLGAIVGYVTNMIAINMLFKEYFGFGGVIVKTRSEFTDSISDLVEKDIINYETIEDRLYKKKFKMNIENILYNFLNKSLYEKLGDKKIYEINGFSDTERNIKDFVSKNFKMHTSDLVESVIKSKYSSDTFSKKQIKILTKEAVNSLMNIIERDNLIESSFKDFVKEQEDLDVKKLLNKSAVSTLESNMIDLIKTLNIDSSYSEKTKKLILDIIDNTEISRVLESTRRDIFSKSFKDISLESNENINREIKEILRRLIERDELKLHFKNISTDILAIGKNLNISLSELLSKDFNKDIEIYTSSKLPILISDLNIWLESKSFEINSLFQEAVDESINDIKTSIPNPLKYLDKLRKAILRMFIGSTGYEGDVTFKLTNFLEKDLKIEELSSKLNEVIDDYLNKEKISEILNNLDSKGIVTSENIPEKLIEIISEHIENLSMNDYKNLFEMKFGQMIDLDSNIDKKIKENLVKLIVEKVIFSKETKEKLLSIGEKGIKNIKDIKLGEKDTLEKLSEFAQKEIIKNRSKIEDKVLENIEETNLSVLNNSKVKERITEEVNNIYTVKVDELIKKYRSARISELLKGISKNKKNIDFILKIVLEFIQKNIKKALNGNIKSIVKENLEKFDDKEISKLTYDFIGKELKPINRLGALLGGIVGFIYTLTFEINMTNFSMGLNLISNIAIFAVIGVLTNIIALEMLFKPYKKIEILSKIPLLKEFSEGYIPKNKSIFAKNMGSFIEDKLLNEDSLKNSFDSNYKDINSKVINILLENDSKILEKTLDGKENKLNIKIYKGIYSSLDENKVKIAKDLLLKLREIEIKDIIKEDEISYMETKILSIIDGTKENSIKNLEELLKSDKKIKDILTKDHVENIKTTLSEKIVSSIYKNLLDKGKARENILLYEGEIQKTLDRPLNKLISSNYKKNIEDKLSNATMMNLKEFTQNKLFRILNEEFQNDKTIGTIFNGMVLEQVEKKKEIILKKAKNFLIDNLLKNEDILKIKAKEQIYSQLNFVQKGSYKLVRGDKLVEAVVKNIIYKKIPIFLKDQDDDLKKFLSEILEKYIYNEKATSIKFNREKIELTIDNVVSENTGILSSNVSSIYTTLIEVLGESSLKNYFNILGIEDLEKIISSFDIEAHSESISDAFETSKEYIVNRTGKEIYEVLDKELFEFKVKDCSRGIEKEDIEESVSNIYELVGRSKTIKDNINEAIKLTYKEKYEDKQIKDILDLSILFKDMEKLIENILEDKNISDSIKNMLEEVTNLEGDSINILDRKSKEDIYSMVVSSGLDAISDNFRDIIESLDLKEVTEVEIDKMSSEKIHTLFNSFAKGYFTKLKIYGIIGGIGGLISTIIMMINSQ